MKRLLVLALMSLPGCFAPAHAGPQASSIVGRWALDTSRMPMPPEARPKRVTITFDDAGSNHLSMDVVIAYTEDNQVHSTGTASLDGTPIAVVGSPEADTAAMKRPAPNVLVLGLSQGGNPASTRVYTVAPDGKSMIETVSALGADRRPTMKTNYFTRLP